LIIGKRVFVLAFGISPNHLIKWHMANMQDCFKREHIKEGIQPWAKVWTVCNHTCHIFGSLRDKDKEKWQLWVIQLLEIASVTMAAFEFPDPVISFLSDSTMQSLLDIWSPSWPIQRFIHATIPRECYNGSFIRLRKESNESCSNQWLFLIPNIRTVPNFYKELTKV
jgi:hypothetical protein